MILSIVVVAGIFNMSAEQLFVGESFLWNFGLEIKGKTANMEVNVPTGYITKRRAHSTYEWQWYITPIQYFSGSLTVTAEWDYWATYTSPMQHKKITMTVSCIDNQAMVYPTYLELAPGETRQLDYGYSYNNQYTSYGDDYFTSSGSCISVSKTGLVTAIEPGTGYVTLHSKISSVSPQCEVVVKEIPVEKVTTQDYSLFAEQTIDLKTTITPADATVKSIVWHESNNGIVSISGQTLTGLNPGITSIYCIVNGTERSNDAEVKVIEPKLTDVSTYPENSAKDLSVFVTPSVTFSHKVTEGADLERITLTGNGNNVEGSVEFYDKTLKFVPTHPLQPRTEYTLYIPKTSIENKWGSSAANDVAFSFTTGDLEKVTLSLSPKDGSFLISSDKISMKSVPDDATIHYTIDGTVPSKNSMVYVDPFKPEKEIVLKAFATREGYENSEVMTAEYYISQGEILSYFPNDEEVMFNYSSVAPYLTLSGPMEKSNNFSRISMKTSSGEEIPGEAFLTHNLVIFVPDIPLNNATTYTVDIPADALKAARGEVFRGFSWSFTTPALVRDIAMQGDEGVYFLSEEGNLSMRGKKMGDNHKADGSIVYNDKEDTELFTSDAHHMTAGYGHLIYKKSEETRIRGVGLSYCGEAGEKTFLPEFEGGFKSITAGFQTTALIDEEDGLWLLGRNDFYQLGDGSGTSSSEYIKLADGVKDVALGNGFTLYVTEDGELYGVGRNHKGQLGIADREIIKTPEKIMEGVDKVYASASGSFAACVTTTAEMYVWGDNSRKQLGRITESDYSSTPEKVLDNVKDCALGEGHTLALTEEYKVMAWGSNAYGQIGNLEISDISEPKLLAENVNMISAGPETSLILFNNGKVTGWGKKTHSNFGTGSGKAQDYIVVEGIESTLLESVKIQPSRFESKPDNNFALVALPEPLLSDFDSVEWISEDPSVASIEGNGIIKANSNGETYIKAILTDRYGNSKEASALIVCTENPDNTGVESIYLENGEWQVRTFGNIILIAGTHPGKQYSLFDMEGRIIASEKSMSEELTFTVNTPGVYIVHSTNRSVKVIVNF